MSGSKWVLDWVAEVGTRDMVEELAAYIDYSDSWRFDTDGDGGLDTVYVTFSGVEYSYHPEDAWQEPTYSAPIRALIERASQAGAAAEREACAELAMAVSDGHGWGDAHDAGYAAGAQAAASAIRARGSDTGEGGGDG